MKIIISGGGTGGHVYPAIAIANALKEKGVKDILFVGANDKMEMQKVPAAGYKIEGLWISGFHRNKPLKNVLFPIKLFVSLLKAKMIIDKFKPDVVVGVGGFASGAVLKIAQLCKIPTLIQEQNSYPGITNKLLARKANKICVAYPDMSRFFDSEKIKLTGNPVRKDLMSLSHIRKEAYSYFDLDQNKKTVLIFGGSLGALSINEALYHSRSMMHTSHNVQYLWQVGSVYYSKYSNSEVSTLNNVKVLPFIDRMDFAYSIADIVVCRAGALTISELTLIGKAAVLVPSPNVAENHQYKNAMTLVEQNAAIMVSDSDAKVNLLATALKLLEDEETQERLSSNIKALGKPNAGDEIAEEIIKLIK